MIMQDKLEKERNDAKNGVEEYVYDLRDKLCGIYEKCISEDVRVMNAQTQRSRVTDADRGHTVRLRVGLTQ